MRLFKNEFGLFLLVFFILSQGASQTSNGSGEPWRGIAELRMPAVAGQFYPSDSSELMQTLKELFLENTIKVHQPVRALIVPHAGYVFSGKVAASGYALLDTANAYDRVFILASSHRAYFKGASIYKRGDYLTPIGKVSVDMEVVDKLLAGGGPFQYVPQAHRQEHSIEVQLPFLQFLYGDRLRIVPIVIGENSPEVSEELAKSLKPYFTRENLFVVSSDFSHYPDYEDAICWDDKTAGAIDSNVPSQFIAAIADADDDQVSGLVTRACGWTSILTLMYLTADQEILSYHRIMYMNSGDVIYGDKTRVVGYHSIALTESGGNHQTTQDFGLNRKERNDLLKLARETIAAELYGRPWPALDTDSLTPNMSAACGAFVTLKKDGNLRGCIGSFSSDQPLYKVIQQMAVAAALEDRRFMPLSKSELQEVNIEISVLTPIKKVESPDEIILGVHGIYIKKGSRSGTFLPQVAEETGWSKEEFLGHCSRDKAKIGWEGWKEAELFTYEAIVFHE